jgi:hypothetical protein
VFSVSSVPASGCVYVLADCGLLVITELCLGVTAKPCFGWFL